MWSQLLCTVLAFLAGVQFPPHLLIKIFYFVQVLKMGGSQDVKLILYHMGI